MSINATAPAVKWFVDVHRRGRVKKRFKVKVACHRPVQLEGGGEDLVRCGTALVEVTGWREQYVGVVRKEITVQRADGKTHTSSFEYHVTQPYTSRADAKQAAENSKKAGQRFEETWATADEATRARWAALAFKRPGVQ